MTKSNLHALSQPEPEHDLLLKTLRYGARKPIAEAVNTELESLLAQYGDLTTPEGRQALVRNGRLPERNVQTGLGDVAGGTATAPVFASTASCYHRTETRHQRAGFTKPPVYWISCPRRCSPRSNRPCMSSTCDPDPEFLTV